MQKYSRTQEKRNTKETVQKYQEDLLLHEEWFYEGYDNPSVDCHCEQCVMVRIEKLKLKLYQKFRNKPAVQRLSVSFGYGVEPDQWSETRCSPIYLLSGESYVCTGLHNRGVTEGYYEFMPLEEWIHVWDDIEDS